MCGPFASDGVTADRGVHRYIRSTGTARNSGANSAGSNPASTLTRHTSGALVEDRLLATGAGVMVQVAHGRCQTRPRMRRPVGSYMNARFVTSYPMSPVTTNAPDGKRGDSCDCCTADLIGARLFKLAAAAFDRHSVQRLAAFPTRAPDHWDGRCAWRGIIASFARASGILPLECGQGRARSQRRWPQGQQHGHAASVAPALGKYNRDVVLLIGW
jgi:hypothetical protein